jgi:formylglycine-generating enzyme required for sulfatase activity
MTTAEEIQGRLRGYTESGDARSYASAITGCRGLASVGLWFLLGCGAQRAEIAGERKVSHPSRASTPGMPAVTSATTGEDERASTSAETVSPPFPELAGADERCPAGMGFVPGGRWTAGQRKRIARFQRTIPGGHMQFHDHVDDFCLDLTEFTFGDVARCAAEATCPRPVLASDAFPGAKEQLDQIERLLDGSDLQRWRETWHSFAALPRTFVKPAEAMDMCAASGRRLPTIEEWLWTAWGGTEDRRYPWGAARPDVTRLNIASDVEVCDQDCEDGIGKTVDGDGFNGEAPVGSFPQGAGRWGHLDLAGNVGEWVRTRLPYGYSGDEEELAARGHVYVSSCGGSSRTLQEFGYFERLWTFPCGSQGRVQTVVAASEVGFRCAAEPVPQDVSAR